MDPETVRSSRGSTVINSKHNEDIRRQTTGSIAFSARLDTQDVTVHAGQYIPFDQIVTNIGNAFHSHSKVFIAPVSGVYVFSVSVISEDNHFIEADLVKNDGRVARVFGYGSPGEVKSQGSVTTVIELISNDEVAVKHMLPQSTVLHGNGYTSFSGYLLSRH